MAVILEVVNEQGDTIVLQQTEQHVEVVQPAESSLTVVSSDAQPVVVEVMSGPPGPPGAPGPAGPPGAPGTGVTDHGELTGLIDDDHPQYHNDIRGDERYYTKAQVDTISVQDRSRGNHTGTQSADTVTDGVSNKVFTATEKTKLAGIAAGATANSRDDQLRDRSTHTGTQSADTIIDGTTNKAFLATERTKLAGIAPGATANDTDLNLKARSNHTGTQPSSTISDFNAAVDGRIQLVIDAAPASLDTLNELAAALGDDPNFAGTVTTSLAGKEPLIAAGTTGQWWRGDKTWQTLTKSDVGLSNVDNTSDANKPISSLTQAALDAKASATALNSHTSDTLNPHAVTKSQVGLGNVPDVDATNRANHTGTQPASTITGLATVATSGAYNDLLGKPSNMPQMSAWAPSTNYVAGQRVTRSGMVLEAVADFVSGTSYDKTKWRFVGLVGQSGGSVGILEIATGSTPHADTPPGTLYVEV